MMSEMEWDIVDVGSKWTVPVLGERNIASIIKLLFGKTKKTNEIRVRAGIGR